METILLTGTSIQGTEESLKLAQTWKDETKSSNLFCTVGVHPHDAKTYNDSTSDAIKKIILENPLAVAIGECGLDYNRNFSSKSDQRYAFREQLIIACQLQKPVFVHEREAHDELLEIIDGVTSDHYTLPPIVIHCFTGTEEEALTYIKRGYYIGFTGTICKKERGPPLCEFIPKIPLHRIMIETDAPFMGFKKGRRSSEPIDVIDVAMKLSEVTNVPFDEVCKVTTDTATSFFKLR